MTFPEMINACNNSFYDLLDEEIIYTPQGGTAKTIMAMIERPLEQAVSGGRSFPMNAYIVNILNDELKGVISVKAKFDKVSLPVSYGGGNVNAVVAKILSQDAGMWKLEVQL